MSNNTTFQEKAEHILKSKLDPKISILNNPDYTFNKVIEAMIEFAELYASSERKRAWSEIDKFKQALVIDLRKGPTPNVDFISSSEGTWSKNQLADEIENSTDIGIKVLNDLIILTIDLMSRGKAKSSKQIWQEACEAQMQEVYKHITPDGNTTYHAIKHWTKMAPYPNDKP